MNVPWRVHQPEATATQTCSVTGNSRFGGEIESVNLIPNWLATAREVLGEPIAVEHGGTSR